MEADPSTTSKPPKVREEVHAMLQLLYLILLRLGQHAATAKQLRQASLKQMQDNQRARHANNEGQIICNAGFAIGCAALAEQVEILRTFWMCEG